jgi:nucleolin
LLSKSCSINTSSQFNLRPKSQATFSPIFRRFASNEVDTEAQKDRESTPSSADSEDQSAIASAISSATESASTYASDAAESLTKNATAARDTVVDTASGVANATGLAFAPRENSRGRNLDDEFTPRKASRPPLVVNPTDAIYVGNLLFEVTEADLEREFAPYGMVKTVRIARDARGLSKGFAYVTFDSVDAATAALNAKNMTILEGRRIVVNYQLKTTRSRPENPPSKTLFIGNLAYEMSDADLNKLFKDVKNVIDVRVAIDRRTGQPRGFCHADFLDVESAVKASEYLSGMKIYGRELRVDFSHVNARPERDSSREGGASGRGGESESF